MAVAKLSAVLLSAVVEDIISPFLLLLSALGLGAAHAFEPDHMAAVSTFVARKPTPRDAINFGVNWAMGHGLSLLLFGATLFFAKKMLENQQPVLFSSGVLDRFVGIVLIGLGIWALVQERVLNRHAEKKRARFESAVREAAELENAQVRDQELPLFGAPNQTVTRAILPGAELMRSNARGSLLMGMLHGAAGTGAFIVQAATSVGATSYALVFGFTLFFSIGVLASMALYAGALGGAISWGGTRGVRFVRMARGATGVLACVVGLCLLLEIEIPWMHFA